MINPEKQFSISETVHKNIEKHQFPSFKNHQSLIGWCSMNYPKILQNPVLMTKPKPRTEEELLANQNIDLLYQDKPQKAKVFQFRQPFQNYQEFNNPIHPEGVGKPPQGLKVSLLSRTTVKQEVKAKILEQTSSNVEQYSNIKPIKCELGASKQNDDYSRKVRQIGEVSYEAHYESEETRHLKKLPNGIITEQNLQEVLGPDLLYLNLSNNTWITNDQINKLGYFAISIEELNLSGTGVTDEVINELAISCKKLIAIDLSRCNQLTSKGIQQFLQMKPDLKKFKANHNIESITDESTQPLSKCNKLEVIDLSYCSKITDTTINHLQSSGCQLIELYLSSCENLKDDALCLLLNNTNKLIIVDLSFNSQKDFGKNVCKKIGNCFKIQTIILTGCSQIGDEQLQQLVTGDNGKQKIDGFQNLKILKLGGLDQVGDGQLTRLLNACPNLVFLEINKMEKITEYGLTQIPKICHNIEKVMLNFTPNIGDNELKAIQQAEPKIQFIRHINKNADIKDDGLRMPYPNESKLKVKKEKKKKKK